MGPRRHPGMMPAFAPAGGRYPRQGRESCAHEPCVISSVLRSPCEGPHDKISIVSISRKHPENAKVVAEPVLFPDGGNDGTSGTLRATTGCHDITVYQQIGLAAGACTGEGVILNIKNPLNPKVLASVEDPNFAFWHSATISNDGKRVLFTDELGGGSQPTCNETVGPNRGADAIYDITDPANPRFISYFKIPRTREPRGAQREPDPELAGP
jgi:hypothetical protein